MNKYAVVIPIKSKNGDDVLEWAKEALRAMGAKPTIIYTDDERAIAGEEYQEYVQGGGIEVYRARGHPAFAEKSRKTTFKK
jgi:hypothetical protein